jgi:hypothetical protein
LIVDHHFVLPPRDLPHILIALIIIYWEIIDLGYGGTNNSTYMVGLINCLYSMGG